jgi:AraC-like DNA-binding protein
MLIHHHTISPTLAAGLVDTCVQRNLNLNVALVAASLTREDIAGKAGRLSAVKFSRLLDHLAIQADDTSFGLRYANDFKLGDLGPFGFGIINAPTLGHAIRFYSRFLPLVADHASFTTDINKVGVAIAWKYTPFLPERIHFVDFCLNLTLRQIRSFAGESWSPHVVHLDRQRPEQIFHLQQVYGRNLIFESQNNALEFSANILNLENPAADNRLFEVIEKMCERELEKQFRVIPLEVKLGDMVISGLADKPVNLKMAASQIGVSPRNLQRLLARRSLSFEKVVKIARREMSHCLLMDSDFTLEQISYRLGYASANVYSRAARVWYGETPRIARAKYRSMRDLLVYSGLAPHRSVHGSRGANDLGIERT